MSEYASILNCWTRDRKTNHLIPGQWAHPDFATLADCPWVGTEKLDGTNVRLILTGDGEFTVRGRTDRAALPPALLDHCRTLEPAMRYMFPDGAVVYGEGVGPRIQKNGGRYGPEQHVQVFDVKVGDWWLTRESVANVAASLGVPTARVVGEMTLRLWVESALLGPLVVRDDGMPAEGVVARPMGDLHHRDGTPIRVKIKERDFAPLRVGGAA